MSETEIDPIAPDPNKPAATEKQTPAPLPPHETFRRYSVLMETSLTLSKLLLLATALLTVLLSWMAGAAPVWVAGRGVLVTLAMGLLLWVGNWMFTRQVMDTVMAEVAQQEASSNEQPAPSTIEKRA